MNGWNHQPLGSLCSIARGGSPRPIQEFLTDAADGINWIKISDATASDRYIYRTAEKIKPAGVVSSRLVKDGDFLLSNSMSFGRPYIMRTSGCIHDGWLVLSGYQDAFDQSFLFHLLGSPQVFAQFDRLAAGSTVRNLNIDLASRVVVPVPSLPEQRRIVAILDEAFEAISTANANAEKNVQNARELFESRLERLFSQPANDGCKTRLSDLCDIKHGYAFDGAHFSKTHDVQAPILLTPGNFSEDGRLQFSERNTKRYTSADIPPGFILGEGDLVVVMTDLSSKMKILGKPAIVGSPHLLHNQRVGRVVNLKALVRARYLYFFMRTAGYVQGIKKTATGTMVKHTAPTRILDAVLPLPSIERQAEIIDALDYAEEQVQLLETNYQRRGAVLDELKKTLLHQAFTGVLTAKSTDKELEAVA